jgi:8-oxo-dGTP diphosphatase
MSSDNSVLEVACALIEGPGGVLCAQRGPLMTLPGLWEFPGGKVESGETAMEALHREIREELSVSLRDLRPLPPSEHAYQPGRTVRLLPFVCRLGEGEEPRPREHARLEWRPASQLRELDWAPADIPVLEHYLKGTP